jgi:hypothetical protein
MWTIFILKVNYEYYHNFDKSLISYRLLLICIYFWQIYVNLFKLINIQLFNNEKAKITDHEY